MPGGRIGATAAALLAIGSLALPLSPARATADGPSTVTSPWPGGRWTPDEARFGVGLDNDVPVKMSDGTILRVDVAYPTDRATGARVTGPFPVLLTQTPYLGTKATAGNYFVQRGYLFVTAHIRGTGASRTPFGFFDAREKQDGAELVRWAASRLTNSNGRIGLQGGSYAGINQINTVVALGKGSPVQATAPACMGADFYRGTYFAGGIPTQTENFQKVIGDAMGGTTAPTGAAFLKDVTSGGPMAYDGKYWRERSIWPVAEEFARADVPALLWSSNGDIYSQTSLELYANLQNAHMGRPIFEPMAADQRPTGRYQIVMGHGGHCQNIDERVLLEWFDTWLKDRKTGIEATSLPIHVHEMISDRWLNTGLYPVVRRYTRYYLSANQKLMATVPGGKGHETIHWAQPDSGAVLHYDTEPMRDGATLAGPISASLFASSTTRNLELIATLDMIDIDGKATTLTTGAVLASLSANDPAKSWVDDQGIPIRPYGRFDADRPVKPGSVGRYDFAIAPRFVGIPPGASLRLTLTTQTPVGKCSPSLGVDPCFPTAPQEASLRDNITTVYFGEIGGSTLNLPLLPAACWRTSDNPGIPYWNVDPALVDSGPCQSRAKEE